MALTEQQFLELEGSIQELWETANKSSKDYLPLMFAMPKSKRARELHQSMGTMGRMQAFNGSVFYDEIELGYEKEYRHGAFTTGIAIDWRLYDDQEYNKIKTKVNDINYSVYKSLQYDGASVFNNAFTDASDYHGPDGVPLCSASHHLVSGDDAQNNTGTDDMTIDAIDTIQQAGMGFKDNRGDIMPVEFDTILCGTYWMKEAKQICGSEKEPYTSDNQKNVMTELSYIINPWITGRKWFMLSSRLAKDGKGLNFYMRQNPKNIERDSTFDELVLKWRAVGRWSYGWDNFYCTYGNNAA
jgi:hypothetical protein